MGDGTLMILDKYISKIKEINSCGADVIMDSVWARVLSDFYKEIDEEVKRVKEIKLTEV